MNTLRIFNHHVHVKFLLLGIFQFFLLIGAVYLAVIIRFGALKLPSNEPNSFDLLFKAAIFALIVMVCMAAMGIYRPQRARQHVPLLARLVAAFVSASLVLSIIFYFLPGLYLGRGILAGALIGSFVALGIVQLFFYNMVDQRSAPWRVLFFGAGENAAEILSYMRRRSDHSLFHLVGCIPVRGEGVKVASHLVREIPGSLLAYARAERIDEIVVVMDERRYKFPSESLIACRVSGINVIDMLTFYERQAGKIKTELLAPDWIIFSYGFRRSALQEGLKRCLDLFVSAVLFLFLWPVMLAVSAAIVIEDGFGEPIIFSQSRVGRGGKEYVIYKFRSMRTDAEAVEGPQWATENDSRVTRTGARLRKYRLDELPQLVNVIRGEMSLVGPRPERPEFVEQLEKNLPYYHLRECVKPGVTGWAQLGYPYGSSEQDANGKLQLDLYYAKNRSLFLDFLILLGTVEVVLFGKGGR